jgi:hypothetical protein
MSKGGAAKNCPAALGSEHLRQLRTLTWRHRCKAGLTRRVFVRFFYGGDARAASTTCATRPSVQESMAQSGRSCPNSGAGFEPSGVPETSTSALCAQFAACAVYGWAAHSASRDRLQALAFVAALPRCLDVVDLVKP